MDTWETIWPRGYAGGLGVSRASVTVRVGVCEDERVRELCSDAGPPFLFVRVSVSRDLYVAYVI